MLLYCSLLKLKIKLIFVQTLFYSLYYKGVLSQWIKCKLRHDPSGGAGGHIKNTNHRRTTLDDARQSFNHNSNKQVINYFVSSVISAF